MQISSNIKNYVSSLQYATSWGFTPFSGDKPVAAGRPKLFSVNEDNIETLVGSANIASTGGEDDKITFKDEKADTAAAKNLGE